LGVEVKNTFMAIDLGLGKTAIALKWFERIRKKYKNSMVVFAPLRVCYTTWPDEIKKWTPHLKYQILHGPHKNTKLNYDADIYIVNYDGLKWFHKMMIKPERRWHRVHAVFDESTFVKSPSTQRFKILKKLSVLFTPYRMCLSATPVPNGYHDLWSQYFIMDGGQSLGKTFYKFRSRFFHYTGPPLYKTSIIPGSQKHIQNLIRPKTFRLKASDYITLPKYIHNEIKVKMDEKEFKDYKTLEKDFFLELDTAEVEAFSAAALSMKLRQYIQGGLYADVPGGYHKIHTRKIDALKEVIEGSAGQSVLCPIQFKFEYDMLCKAFKQQLPIIAGRTSAKESITLIREWNRGTIGLLLCHPASISHGINLQASGHIICWLGLTWSLEQYRQLIGRIYRQGQRKAVTVHHLIMKGTVDEKVLKALKKKDAVQSDLLLALKSKL